MEEGGEEGGMGMEGNRDKRREEWTEEERDGK